MGWVWSDELARTLRESPEFSTHIPGSWTARPSAFATLDDETPVATVRRLLGMSPTEIEVTGAKAIDALAIEILPTAPCTCGMRSS